MPTEAEWEIKDVLKIPNHFKLFIMNILYLYYIRGAQKTTFRNGAKSEKPKE